MATLARRSRAGTAVRGDASELTNRICSLSQQATADFHDLLGLLQKETDERERAEIAKTMTEILFPDEMQRRPAESDEQIEARARGRLDAYRTKVGIAVKRHREKLGLTQKRLAKKAGLPQSHISRLERGKHVPTYATIERIAAALGVKPAKLDPGYAN